MNILNPEKSLSAVNTATSIEQLLYILRYCNYFTCSKPSKNNAYERKCHSQVGEMVFPDFIMVTYFVQQGTNQLEKVMMNSGT